MLPHQAAETRGNEVVACLMAASQPGHTHSAGTLSGGSGGEAPGYCHALHVRCGLGPQVAAAMQEVRARVVACCCSLAMWMVLRGQRPVLRQY